MNALQIRKATINDLEELLTFEQGVISAERPLDPTLKEDPVRYYDIEKMIGAPNVELLVAEFEGAIIASGYARIEDSKLFYQHPKHVYLGFMYVVPEHRGKGVNKKIIEALESWSLKNNITEIWLDVYHNNEAAIKAYERAGFSRYILSMRKELLAI